MRREEGIMTAIRIKDKDKIDFVKLNRDSEVIRYNSELANAGVRIKKKSKIIIIYINILNSKGNNEIYNRNELEKQYHTKPYYS